MAARATEACAVKGEPTEGAQWVLYGMLVAMALAPAIAFAGMYWADRHHERREAWAAEHPHEQVEPPRVPEHYRYVDRDVLEPSDHAALDQMHARRPAAPDHDPAIGDLVITFVDLVVDGEPVRDWIVARVVWPRDTYVRARVGPTGSAAAGLISARDIIDVPRETIASAVHLTGPAMPEPDPGS
jgi:hypothetical protein